MASSSSTIRMRGRGSGVLMGVDPRPSLPPGERALLLATVDLRAQLAALVLEALGQALAGDRGPGPLLGALAELAELPIAPQLVLELVLEHLDHDRVVEEAEPRHLVRDQVLRIREVRE